MIFYFFRNHDLLDLFSVLHGICYDFFFVTGQIYVDQDSPKELSAQSQSFNIFWTQGLGLLVGAQVCGYFYNNAFAESSGTDGANLSAWANFWWPLAGMAAIVLIIFLIAFKHKDPENAEFKHE